MVYLFKHTLSLSPSHTHTFLDKYAQNVSYFILHACIIFLNHDFIENFLSAIPELSWVCDLWLQHDHRRKQELHGDISPNPCFSRHQQQTGRTI